MIHSYSNDTYKQTIHMYLAMVFVLCHYVQITWPIQYFHPGRTNRRCQQHQPVEAVESHAPRSFSWAFSSSQTLSSLEARPLGNLEVFSFGEILVVPVGHHPNKGTHIVKYGVIIHHMAWQCHAVFSKILVGLYIIWHYIYIYMFRWQNTIYIKSPYIIH